VNSDDRLRAVMAAMLDVDPATIGPATSTDTVENWDSVTHMNLVIAIEEAFGITVPDEEVASLTSWDLVRVVVQEQLASA
jgi:acyl carrier protein